MPSGLVWSQSGASGVTVTHAGGKLFVTQRLDIPPGAPLPNNCAVSLPLDQFLIKNIVIPSNGLTKKELAGAARLQVLSALAQEGEETHHSSRLGKVAGGHALLIVAARAAVQAKAAVVIPEPLALHALALTLGLLADGERILVLFNHGGRLVSIFCDGFEPVFMRSLPCNDPYPELRLSCQARYLREESTLPPPDKVVWFDEERPDLERAGTLAGASAVWIAPSDLIDGVLPEDAASCLIAAATALCSKISSPFMNQLKRHLHFWNVRPGSPSAGASIMRGARYALPLVPLFAAAWLYADTGSREGRLEGLKGKTKALSGKYQYALKLEREVVALEDLADGPGLEMRSAQAWHGSLAALTKLRPDGLWLTSISGKIDNTVLVSGKAGRFEQVAEYISSLGKAPQLSEVTLIGSQGGNDKGVDFQFSFSVGLEKPGPAGREPGPADAGAESGKGGTR